MAIFISWAPSSSHALRIMEFPTLKYLLTTSYMCTITKSMLGFLLCCFSMPVRGSPCIATRIGKKQEKGYMYIVCPFTYKYLLYGMNSLV